MKFDEWFDKICNLLHLKVNKKTRALLIQIFKFVIVGFVATIIDWVFFYLFNKVLGIYYIISAILSFIISVTYNYLVSVKWVFVVNKEKTKLKNFIVFVVFSVIGLLLTLGIMKIGVDYFKVTTMVMKMVSTLIVMVFNFVSRKMFLE